MGDSDIVQEFLVESYENLDRLDRELVGLEKNPQDKDALASVFRTIHTIKGTCGFLGFNKLEAVAHVGENLLTRLRDRQLTLNPEITTALLGMVDVIRQMLGNIEKTAQEGERDDSTLIVELTRLQQSAPGETLAPAAVTPTASAAEPATQPATSELATAPAAVSAPASGPVATPAMVSAPSVDPNASLGDILMQRAGVSRPQIERALQEQRSGDPRHLGEILVEHKAVRPAELVDALHLQQAARGQAAAASVSDSTIRVDVGLLDKLMNLVGELVLARNQVLQFTNKVKDTAFQATSQRLNLITTELQEGVMKTRMQPIDNVWSKFPRTVRDVALTCGKQVVIEMEGKETELDKTIIEAIKDPLTHLVRNSVDHGIESSEVRRAKGKDPAGKLSLRAFHEGGQVNIEISDDGAGLDTERIRRKAIEKSLVTAEQAARMSEREIVNLIFLPGFSTAEKVSNVSGRGVGMDVVKTNIEKIGGTVDVQSKAGAGTTVRMKIPLTLAIIPALIVSSGGDRYAIPQVSLVELVRLDAEQKAKGIEMVHGAPVHRLRGRLLPLVYLDRELDGNGKKGTTEPGGKNGDSKSKDTKSEAGQNGNRNRNKSNDAVNIVVLQADDRQFGLVVDQINDTEEIVVKPLGKQLKGVSAFSGATIMGDGKVALILDAMGLAQRANVVSEVRERAAGDKGGLSATNTKTGNRQTLLLFQPGSTGRMAMPLSLVARLEEFDRGKVEQAGEQEVVQYRGRILPLIRVANVVLTSSASASDVAVGAGAAARLPLQVVVYAEHGRSVGLVVERILDIVEQEMVLEHPARHAGILGSLLVQQRVTDLLDVQSVVRSALPSFFEKVEGVAAAAGH